jgi:mannose-6-phosphate isomerase
MSSPVHPIIFEYLPMERVWGGRRFESLLGKSLPQGVPIGELWEMVDRPEAQSVVHQGAFRGKTLHTLWNNHRVEIFGELHLNNPSQRFPLLIKLLDARERLSVQVHPPAAQAKQRGGEPKTECWYFLHAPEGAAIYAGLRKGTTRESFETALKKGTVEETLHRAPSHTGQSIFIPSGRLHAIGEGLLIVEVQQNSDTTYRVFDWNRLGLDGKPRALHIEESLDSIDFKDFEPPLNAADESLVADCPYFRVEKHLLSLPLKIGKKDDFSIITCLTGGVECSGLTLFPGDFMLVPACLTDVLLSPSAPDTSILVTRLPEPKTKAV